MSDTKIIRFDGEKPSGLYDDEPPLSRDIYYWFDEEDGGTPWLAHVCTLQNSERGARWLWSAASSHQLVSREPLHLEPSISWQNCCGRHGFIRNGQWEPVGDGGWQA